MKPAPFNYLAPESLEEAVALRAEHGDESAVLAGGQSLMPLLNLRYARPAVVIDLGRVAELRGIREVDGSVAIGATTPQRETERSPLVAERVPLLVQALRFVGHPAIRNRGTVGGSLAHADPAAELPAVAVALDAQLVARSARGERTMRAREFFRGFLTTALEPDELLVEARFPRGAARSAFLEVARRHGDFALVALAANGSTLAFAGVGPEPVLVDARDFDAARLEPPGDVHATAAYRRRIAATLARRALAEVGA